MLYLKGRKKQGLNPGPEYRVQAGTAGYLFGLNDAHR
jgi:hypothetical protein